MPLPLTMPGARAKITVEGIAAHDPDEGLEEVRKFLSPNYDVTMAEFRLDYFGSRSLGEMSIDAMIIEREPDVDVASPTPGSPESEPPTGGLPPAPGGTPMIVMPPVPHDANVVTVDIDCSFAIGSIQDATTLGSFLDEVTGHMKARAEHYGFKPGTSPMINVRTEHAGG